MGFNFHSLLERVLLCYSLVLLWFHLEISCVWVHSNRVCVLRFSTAHSLRIYTWNEAQYNCHWIFFVCFLGFTLFYPLFSHSSTRVLFYFKTCESLVSLGEAGSRMKIATLKSHLGVINVSWEVVVLMVMPVQYSTMSESDLITRNLMVRAYAEDDFPDQAPSLFHELQVPGMKSYIVTVMSIPPVALAEKILIPTLTALVPLAVPPALPSSRLQWNYKLHVYQPSAGQSLGSVRTNDVNEVHTLHGMFRLDVDQNVSDVPPSLHKTSLKQPTSPFNILYPLPPTLPITPPH